MPAPANDNFANAIDLNSGPTLRRYAAGTNVDATSEPGEPANNGRTVWWKWTCPITDKYTFATRFDPDAPFAQTDFETVLEVFSGSGFGLLTRVGVGRRYAGWELQSEVNFEASEGTVYHIRVDGSGGAQGTILLWYQPFDIFAPGSCDECPPRPGKGLTCMGNWTPGIFAEAFRDFSAPHGTYLIRYCRGAWQYRDGWVVGRVPSGATQSWPGNQPGWFFDVFYQNAGSQVIHLPESLPNQALGWTNSRRAQTETLCKQTRFKHDGSGLIRLHFNDQAYADNFLSPLMSSPVYSLVKADPVFEPVRLDTIFRTAPGTYEIGFIIYNASEVDFDGITVTLLPGGGITSGGSPLTNKTFLNLHQTGCGFFPVTISPTTKLDVTATLTFSNGFDEFEDMIWDLTPQLVTTLFDVLVVTVGGVQYRRIRLTIQDNALPTLNLVATPQISGGVTAIFDTAGTPISSITLGVVNFGSANARLYQFLILPASGAVTLTIDYADTTAGLAFPSAAIDIP